MDNKWKQDLELRAEMMRNQEHLRPMPGPVAVSSGPDVGEITARCIRQALLSAERARARRVILWLSTALAASVAANVFQGLLYAALLKRF